MRFRFFGGKMEVNYRLEKDASRAARLAKDGYRNMGASAVVPAGEKRDPRHYVHLWVRTRGGPIQSYGTVTAILTMTSTGPEMNKQKNEYRTNFELDGKIDFNISDEPNDPQARQRSQAMANSFRRTVMRDFEKFKNWLNRPRTLMNVQEIKVFLAQNEGGEVTYVSPRVEARWCGERRIVPRVFVDITARDVRVLVNTPLGLKERDPEKKPR